MALNKFGRLQAPKDIRDLHYTPRKVASQLPPAKPRTTAYRAGPLLNQKLTPKCVAFTGKSFLMGAPMMSKFEMEPTTDQLYDWSQARDEWPGTNYDGTSTSGLMKALTDAGLIGGYAWPQSADEGAEWLVSGKGTLCAGSDWFAQMSNVDAKGFMQEPPRSMATPIGGHEWWIRWYSKKLDAFLMRNSWGNDFGQADKHGVLNGEAWVRRDFLQWLIFDQMGDLVAPTQVKLIPVKVL